MTIIRKSCGGMLVILVVVPLILVSKCAVADFISPEPLLSNSEVYEEQEKIKVAKRPFCNAFSGCGRKRSEPEENEDYTAQLIQRLSQQVMQMIAKQKSQEFQSRSKVTPRSPIWDFAAERKRRMIN